jgi:hypothetical protein
VLAICGIRLPNETCVNTESGIAPCRLRCGRVQSKAITCLFLKRGNVHCAWDSHFHQMVDRRLSSVTPPLLRQQLVILRRQVKRPACTKTDRVLLVLLARIVQTWKQALFIVQPETLLRWHRQGFKLYWKYKSRAPSAKPKISEETVALRKRDGQGQPAVGSRTDPWRITQAGYSRLPAAPPRST